MGKRTSGGGFEPRARARLRSRRVASVYIFLYIPVMARRYSVAEARAHLPSILVQAEAGEAIELTRRGQPVAVVLSHEAFERLRNPRPSFGEAYRSLRKKHALDEVGLDDDFASSVRDRTTGRPVKL